MRAVAVLGDGAGLAEAARLADVDQDEAAGAADLLVGLAILRPAERLEFAHPIVREAVYADIGSHERAAAHARAAVILAERRRLRRADRGPDRRRRSRAAMPSESSSCAAWPRTRSRAERPPRPSPGWGGRWRSPRRPRPGRRCCSSSALRSFASATPEAVDHLTAAVELIREPALLATAARLLANALTMVGRRQTGPSRRSSRRSRSSEPADRELALLLEAELAAHAQQASREARAPAARRLGRHAELEGATPGERLVLASLAFERARASESAGEAAGLHRAGARRRPVCWASRSSTSTGTFYLLVVGLLATDALDLADACLEQALADAQRARLRSRRWPSCSPSEAWVSMRRGAMARAEADARTALELLTAHDIPLGAALALAVPDRRR